MAEVKIDDVTRSASPRWIGASSIPLAYQLNEQCLELVCDLAKNPSAEELPLFILENRDLWRLLEPEARKRLAEFPFVILDLHFRDAELWRLASVGHPMPLADNSKNARYSILLSKPLEDLALETLLFARQVARENASVAKVIFAMTASVVRLIALFTVSQIRATAIGNAHQLRVRWDGDPEFWSKLLAACRSGDQQDLEAIRRHAKLRFSGEFVSTHLKSDV
jgi:hypothetical protein